MKLIAFFFFISFCGFSQDGSHVFSGLFDIAGTVQVIAIATPDSAGSVVLFRGAFTDSYTLKVIAINGIEVFFYSEGYREKIIYLPEGGNKDHNIHAINVRFKKSTNYLIYKAGVHKKQFETQILQ